MSTINFTNSSGLALQFPNHDLDLVLTELTTGNTYYSVGNNDLVYIMLGSGYLLVMDISNTINRKLFESYHFSSSNLYPFQIKLTHDSTSAVMSINDALIASGYSGVTPVSSLASVYMMLYIQSGSNIDVYSKDQINQLLLKLIDNAPSNLDTLNELALALQGESTQEANDVASILTQLANKLNKSNPGYTGTLNNSDNSFLVDVSGNITCHNALFNGIVSGLTMAEISGLVDALTSKANLSGCTFTGTVNGINKSMIGLDQVDNTADKNKVFTESQITGLVTDLSSKQPLLTTNSVPISYVSGLQASLNSLQPTIGTGTLSIANKSGLQASLDSKANLSGCTFTGTVNGITKSMVGLSNVDNVADASKVFAESQISNLVTDLASKQPLDSTNTLASLPKNVSTTTAYFSGFPTDLLSWSTSGSATFTNSSGMQHLNFPTVDSAMSVSIPSSISTSTVCTLSVAIQSDTANSFTLIVTKKFNTSSKSKLLAC